jgi:hypothetical protein
VVHSTSFLTSFTAGSFVVGEELKSCGAISGDSTSGVFMLVGCEPRRSLPNLDAEVIVPLTIILPKATVCPGATVPSWQLRHNLLEDATVGAALVW